MYPKYVELRIQQYNYLVASSWHFKLFHEEDARSNNPQVTLNQVVDCIRSAQDRKKGECLYSLPSLYVNLSRVLVLMLVRNVVITGKLLGFMIVGSHILFLAVVSTVLQRWPTCDPRGKFLRPSVT